MPKIERPDGGRFGESPLSPRAMAEREKQANYLVHAAKLVMEGQVIAFGICLLSAEHATQHNVWCTPGDVHPLEVTGALWNLAMSANKNLLATEERADKGPTLS